MGGNRRNEQRGGRGGRTRAARPYGAPYLLWAVGALLAFGIGAAGASTPGTEMVADAEGWQSQPLRVHVWHGKDDGDIYRRGESLQVRFQTNVDAYAVVYRIDSDGEVTILWPRSRYDDGFVFGGHDYGLPAAGSGGLRAGGEEGVEYVEAVASLYPFDLRDLEVDFHHETDDRSYRFAVAGDPFLAMNEINFTITGLEDPSDYVVTDYASWYVHRRVDHPRYLCGQCHEADYRPYDDHCAVEIHYDFGWANRWYLRFGYYPAYYYPAYYYVDPWSWRPWVNYWYTPWYRWPSAVVYEWPHLYYPWWDSPYYRGDVWVVHGSGHRRHSPLSKLYETRDREPLQRRRNLMVADRATDDIKDALRRRQPLGEGRGVGPSNPGRPSTDGRVKDVNPVRAGGGYRNVDPSPRERASLLPVGDGTARRPGLRLDAGDRLRAGTGSRGRPQEGAAGERENRSRGREGGSDRVLTRPDRAGEPGSSGEPQRAIRPVQPRKPGTRIWSGNRSTTGERPARPEVDRPAGGGERSGTPRVEQRDRQDRQRPEAAPQRPSSRPERVQPARPAERDGKRDEGRSGDRGRGASRPSVQAPAPQSQGSARPSSPPPSSPPPARGGSESRARGRG